MIYSMNKVLYDTYIEAFTARDMQGCITRQGTYSDVLTHITQTFGLLGEVTKIELR